MRKQTQDDLKKIYNEEELLKGNISRMCVTNDLEELSSMTHYAIERIKKIYNINYSRLTESEKL